MAQISKGETFADSQQLTATRLNQLVDSAQILVGVISDQTSITANTLEASDTTLINDGGTLKKASVGDFLNSGLSVTTPTINTPANKDIIITPNDSASVVGSNYTSGDGLTVVVTTLSAHGLAVNNVVLISGAGTGYNGTFKITAVTSLTFTYVLYTAATPTASPTACTYVRKASEIVNGNIVASEYIYAGSELDTNNLQVDGTALINTSTTRTANVTTSMQYSGVPVWGLVSISEYTVPFGQCTATTEPNRTTTCNLWRDVTTITSLDKTTKEIWTIDADFPIVVWSQWFARFRIIRQSTGQSLAMENYKLDPTGAFYCQEQIKMSALLADSVSFSGETLVLQFRYDAGATNASSILNVGYGGSMTYPEITSKLRLTKYAKP